MATSTSGEFTLHASPANDVTRATDDALVISEVNNGPLYGPDGDYSYNKAQRITSMGDNYIVASGRAGSNDSSVKYGLFKRSGTDWVTVDTLADPTTSMGGGLSSNYTYLEMATVNDTTAIHAWRDSSDEHLHLQVVVRDGDSLSVGTHIVGLANYSGFFYGSPVSIVPLNDTEFIVLTSGWVSGVANDHQHLIHVTRSGTNLTITNDQVFNNNSEQWVGLGAVAISNTQVAYAIANANTTYGNAVIGWLLTRSSGGATWTLSDTATIRALPNGRVENDLWSFSSGASGRAGRVLSDTAAFAWWAFDDSGRSVDTGIIRVSGTSIVSTDSYRMWNTTLSDEAQTPTIASWKDAGVWVVGRHSETSEQLSFYRFTTDGATITQEANSTFLLWSDWGWGCWLEPLGSEGGVYGAFFETHNDGDQGSGFGRLMTFGNPPPSFVDMDGVGETASDTEASFELNKNFVAEGSAASAASADLETLFEPTLWAFDLTNAYGFKEKTGNIPSAIEGVGSSASSSEADMVTDTNIEGGVGASSSSGDAEMEFAPPTPSGTCDWVEIGTANLGSAYSNTTRITVREVDQYRLLVMAPDTTNINTAWSLVHADFWGVEVVSSGTFTGFDVRDAFPLSTGKLLAVGTDNRVSVIIVSGDSVSFGSTYTLTPVATPSTGVGYGPSGTDDQFIQAWGEGTGSWDVPGQRQWARAWNISGQTISAGSDEQQYLDVAGYTGGNNGMSPHLGVHHFGDGVLMPFGNRYYYTSRTYKTDQGCGVIVNWDGTNFTFVPGPNTWYTDGSWHYGSGGQRNPHFEVDDGGDCVAAYAVYDNVSGYDHGFHRYGLNSTKDGITVQSAKHGIGLVENSLAAISLGETTIAMGDQRSSRATSPRAVNICTMDSTWSVHSYHGLPHSATQYGIGCGTTDRIAVGVWGDGNDVYRKLRAWYR